jgi:hypothetical protein
MDFSVQIQCRFHPMQNSSPRALHPGAFAVSAEGVAALGGGAFIPASLRAQVAQPLGNAVIINKISVTNSDVLPFPFFFL